MLTDLTGGVLVHGMLNDKLNRLDKLLHLVHIIRMLVLVFMSGRYFISIPAMTGTSHTRRNPGRTGKQETQQLENVQHIKWSMENGNVLGMERDNGN